MQRTQHYQLKKIELSDSPPDITVINGNWDTIDATLDDLEGISAESLAHGGNGVIHITDSERTAWNGKAAGNHTHAGLYAPISHSND